jgi:glycosyltransferase involved in cell wall biosynthesis
LAKKSNLIPNPYLKNQNPSMPNNRGTFLLIGFDDFSNINSAVEKELRKNFSDWKFESIHLKPILKQKKITILIGIIAVYIEFFSDFISGQKKIKQWRRYLYSTGFMFSSLSAIAEQLLSKKSFEISLQTQGLFRIQGGRMGHFIYTDHTNLNNLNYPLIQPRQYLASTWFRRQEIQLYRQATGIFVMSANIGQSLQNQYGINESKIFLVYAGGDQFSSKEFNSEKYYSKNILFVGKDWIRKGGPLLLEAFELVLKEVPDARLTIIGCKPNVKLPNCSVLGELPGKVTDQYYEQAAVFCLPTKREPFGMVYIEAMFHSLPVVTTKIGATKELIVDGSNGFRLDFNAEEFSKHLVELLVSPQKAQEFGTTGFLKVSQNYTWNKVGEKMTVAINKSLEHCTPGNLLTQTA